MKRFFVPVLAATGIIILILLVPRIIPTNAGPKALYIALLLLDIYLWSSLRKTIKSFSKPVAITMTILYWLPLITLAGASVAVLFRHYGFWPVRLRVWIFAITGVAYASKIIPALFLLLADLLRLFRFLWRCTSNGCQKGKPAKGAISRSRFLRYAGLLGGGLIFSGMLAGMIRWVYDFRIHRIKIPLKGLPKTFEGYRIVQFSDLHIGSWSSGEPLEEAVEMILSLKPDMVVFTGDLVNYQTGEVEELGHLLGKISAPDGVIAIMGNHDYGNYTRWDTPQLKRQNLQNLYNFYDTLGWRLLRNETVVVENGGEKIAIIGVENWGASHRFPKKGNIEKAKTGLDEKVTARILLSHDPTHWQYIISKQHPDIGLTLSGHTHGMQMGIETKQFRWSPAQYIYRYWAGLYKKDNESQYLYVNRGLGHIGYPGRIGIRPEITLIELRTQG